MAIFNGTASTVTVSSPVTTGNLIGSAGNGYNVSSTMYTGNQGYTTSGGIGGAGGAGGAGQYIISNGTSAQWATTKPFTLVINGPDNKEIVRLNGDGTVTWADTIEIDAAVDAFGRALSIGVEHAAGLTYAVKQRMRDTVFEEMISMAREKGSLTADDLTYLHQAAKIMDKLKGKE